MERYQLRDCPACGDKPDPSTRVSSKVAAETLSFADLQPYWNGFFKEKIFFSYYRCGGCGMLFAPTFFTSEQLEKLYREMPDNTAGIPIEALRRTQYGYFRSLKEHSSLEGDFLEVGPDIGLFTENCVREGAFKRYWLFEPNRSIWPSLKKIIGEKEGRIVPEMFDFTLVPDNSVSSAVMIQVLDHLLDPAATLRKLRQKLMPLSVLLVVTHDESSILRKITGSGWPAYCLQHPQLFNPDSIKVLMNAAGYEVIHSEKTVNHFPVMYLLKHLLWALGIRLDIPQSNRLSVGLKLGNMINIAIPA
jgi:Methyltransferase domain